MNLICNVLVLFEFRSVRDFHITFKKLVNGEKERERVVGQSRKCRAIRIVTRSQGHGGNS